MSSAGTAPMIADRIRRGIPPQPVVVRDLKQPGPAGEVWISSPAMMRRMGEGR